MLFIEERINEYWVDVPVKFRSEIEKELARKFSRLKKIKAKIKTDLINDFLKIVYNTQTNKYEVKSIK